MTELEALRRVLEMALPRSALNEKDAAALELVQELVNRVEKLEANEWEAIKAAEAVMAQRGYAVVTYICAEDVRELLREEGLEEFADSLSDEAVITKVDQVIYQRDLPDTYSYWRSDVEYEAAKVLAEEAGVPWSA